MSGPETIDIARAVLGALLSEDARAERRAADVAAWVAADPSRLGDRRLAWAAARATEVAFAELDAGAASDVPADVIAEFRALPAATRVVVALHELCGLDDYAVSRATGQPVERVAQALDVVGGAPAQAPPLPPAGAVVAPPEAGSPPPPPVTGAIVAPTTPPAPPTATPAPLAPPVAPRVPQAPPVAPPAPSVPPTTPPAPPAPPLPQAEPPADADADPQAYAATRADAEPDHLADLPPAGPVPQVVRRRRRVAQARTPRWWVVAIVVVLALVAAGLIASNLRDDTPAATPPAPGLTDPASVRREQQSTGCGTPDGDAATTPTVTYTEVDGSKRSYRVTAAAPLEAGRPRPLLILAGDVGQSPDDLATAARVDQLAAALRLVVVVLTPAAGTPQWNVIADGGDPDDLGLIDAVINAEGASRCIDRTRVIVGGQGVGAHLAAAYACRRPGVASGLVMIAGARLAPDCTARGPLSILALLGDADPVLPLDGTSTAEFESRFGAERRAGSDYDLQKPTSALDGWASALDCEGTATENVGLITMHIDTTCSKGGEIWRVVLPGGGHEWYPATYDLLVQFLTSAPLTGDGG